MPSSPSFTDYQRQTRRFFYRGISLQPQDALAEGKLAFALNIRSYEEGTLTIRDGLDLLTNDPLPDPAHSLFRLNDASLYDGGVDAIRFRGAGADLYAGTPTANTYASIDSGYSGDPLTAVTAAPFQSPRPWLYIADADRMRKVNTSLDVLPIGLPQPTLEPSAFLASNDSTFLNLVGVGGAAWVAYGDAAVLPPGPVAFFNRVAATITQFIPDTTTPGMCSVALDMMLNVTEGMAIDLGGAGIETVIIDTVHPPVSDTTIAAILYDSGTTGLCTIQPTGGFSIGQIELPTPEELSRRFRDVNAPVASRQTVNRTVDYPVDCLVLLGGVEVVRIISVAVGRDGVQSFRCSTAGTFAATATISGIASFRAYCTNSHASGDSAVANAMTASPLPLSVDPIAVGFQSPMTGGTRNWNLVGTRATQPDDIIAMGVRISNFGAVQSIRLYLNLSDDTGLGGSDFLHNYYVYEWRASDLQAAVQSASPGPVDLLSSASQTAVFRGLVDDLYRPQYGANPTTGAGFTADGQPTFNGAPTNLRTASTLAQRQRAHDQVAVGAAPARQMALGDEQWMTLQCRVGDLTRIGTDTTMTLGAINGCAIVFQIAADPIEQIQIDASDCYLRGGYGPDVASTLPPYVYRYRYRDVITGARSNPSPPVRASVKPRRGRVTVQGASSGVSSDIVTDWFRFGGAMAKWAYTGSSPDGAAFNDDNSDEQIDGGEIMRVDLYQPWPVSDLPRKGTCNVAGTAIEWVSGDTFDVRWAADSAIIVNGVATQLFSSPSSSTKLQVVDNCGSGSAVVFELPSPTILAQPMPALFGGALGGAWFQFGCGDASDPGSIRWTNGNDPDTASDANYLVVSSASEPLVNGWIDDAGIPYVFSTEQLYRLQPNFGGLSPFVAVDTACNVGLWCQQGFAVTKYGTFFLAKDGIYLTQGGSPPVCITSPDLKPLFPQDGTTAEAIRNLNPVDMTAISRLRLAMVGEYLYFDYVDTAGENHTLVYEPQMQRWTPDVYTPGALLRVSEPGPQVLTQLVEGADGNLYQIAIGKTADNLDQIPWAVWTTWEHGGDPRSLKQWGDSVLDMNPGGSYGGVFVTPVVENGNVRLATQTLGLGAVLRDTFIVNTGAVGSTSTGYGVLSRNYGLLIEGCIDRCDVQRPLLFLWEPAYLFKQTPISTRATDWEDLGYPGAKFVQGVVLRANTFGQDVDIVIEYDGPNGAPQQALTFTINHDGEQTIAYPAAAAGWTPFIGQLIRIRPADDNTNEFTLLSWRFVWEPAPELATQWETQYTTFGAPGFLDVFDGIVAYQSTATLRWFVEYQDGFSASYTLPSSSGQYLRTRQILQAQKGKAVRFRWTSTQPFRLFKKDMAVRVQAWGAPGGYQSVNPFGGPSYVDGAGI